MTAAPEVQWLFDTLDSALDGTPLAWGSVSELSDGLVPVRRVDRDASSIYDMEPIRSRKGDLQVSNFVGAALDERPTSPAGTDEYRSEAIVSVRIEGLHYSKYGHINPDGVDGIPFEELYTTVRQAIRDGRQYPDVARPNTAYQTAILENETDRSSNYRDFYEYRFDVRFRGFES